MQLVADVVAGIADGQFPPSSWSPSLGPDGLTSSRHVLNPTGYAATIQVDVNDPTGLLNQPLAVPARTGAMLGLGLRLPDAGTIVSSNAEIAELAEDRIRFAPGLGRDTEVWLRTERTVIATRTRVEDRLTVITGPAGAALDIAFA